MGSVPNGIIGMLRRLNPSGPTTALGVDSGSNRDEYQGYLVDSKRCWSVGLTTLPPPIVNCLEILGVSTFWSPEGLSRPVMD